MTSTKKTISEYTTEKLKSMEGSFVLGGEAYITKDAQVFKKSGDLWMPCREFATKGYRAVRLDDGHIYYVHQAVCGSIYGKACRASALKLQ